MKATNYSDGKKKCKAIGKVEKIQIALIVGLIAIFFAGCSGGGSGSDMGHDMGVDASAGAASRINGVFMDGPVHGLNYMTETHTGITDEMGSFTCFEGEMITFTIGDMMLGKALADEVMTPMDFLDESEIPFDVTHPMITNMGRFLQALDSDGDPENGITISPEVREEMNGRMIDFRQNIEDFENDPDVTACFDVFNGLNMPRQGLMWELVPVDQARQHMIENMGQYTGRFMESEESEESASPDDTFAHPMEEFMEDRMDEYRSRDMGH